MYTSTRDRSVAASFEAAVFRGFSADGGLFVPAALPPPRPAAFWEARRGASFVDLAAEIVPWFVPEEEIPRDEVARIVARVAAEFTDAEVTPVRRYSASASATATATATATTALPALDVLELFHGPTLAFKDVAMQFLLACLQYFLRRRGQRLALLVATTGDTGPAAIAAARPVPEVECTVLYTRGRISPLQEWQMLSPTEPHVHAVSVPATSDELDAVVRRLFQDAGGLGADVTLGTVNSFNWARVLFQSVAYVYAYLHHPDTAATAGATPGSRRLTVYVPAGGAGNALSALYARWLGVPIDVVACSNDNDTLPRLLHGAAVALPVRTVPTLSPCMDISVPSNLERLLFHGWEHAHGGPGTATAADCAHIAATMAALVAVDAAPSAVPATLQLPADLKAALTAELTAAAVSSAATAEAIRQAHADHGVILDPHTAVAYAVWRQREAVAGGAPRATLVAATASPTKFFDTITAALGPAVTLPFRDVDAAALDALRAGDRCLRAESAPEAEALLRRLLPVWCARRAAAS